jgi:tryptophanyl-tRNA synthetase
MKKNYEVGNYGYGHAKQALFELICKQFSDERERYNQYIANPDEIVQALALGAEKANAVANKVLSRVRQKLGY